MMDIYQAFSPTSFTLITWKLKLGEFIAPAELALALEANPDVAPPPAIHDYLIRTLREEVKAPRRRKPGGAASQLLNILAVIFYERDLAWLQARRRRFGRLPDWPSADWNQGPPHERAARMVVRRLRLHYDWRHLLNRMSRQRRPRQR